MKKPAPTDPAPAPLDPPPIPALPLARTQRPRPPRKKRVRNRKKGQAGLVKVARACAVQAAPLTEEQLLAVPWSEHQLLTKHEVATSTVIRKMRFLREFAERGIILHAARAAKVSRQVVTTWRQNDPNFNDLMADAHEDALDRLEEEARRRAADGVEEPVFQAGKEVGRIRRYSDHLLMMFLKGKRRDQFSERTETTGPNGSPLSPTVVMVSWHASMKPPEQP